MTVLLGRMLNGVCWGVIVGLRGSGSQTGPASPANATTILVATL